MVNTICLFCPYRAILTLRFGIIINDGPICRANVIGLFLNTGYLTFYYWYISTANDRKAFWKQIAYGAAVAAIVIAYSFIESPEHLQKRYGMVLTVILFYFVGSPLLSLVSTVELTSLNFVIYIFLRFHCFNL